MFPLLANFLAKRHLKLYSRQNPRGLNSVPTSLKASHHLKNQILPPPFLSPIPHSLYTEVRGCGRGHQASCSIITSLCLTSFRQCFPLNLELGWQPAAARDCPVNSLTAASYTLHRATGAKLGPHGCAASALTR